MVSYFAHSGEKLFEGKWNSLTDGRFSCFHASIESRYKEAIGWDQCAAERHSRPSAR